VRSLFSIILISILALLFNVYINKTQLVPKVGGEYKEGILGQPRFINPILAPTNDADRDLTQLVYSSLFKYDSQGNLIPDLVEKYNIEEDNLIYNITLKKNVFWHDGEPLTANDVIFTIKTIQDEEYKSPLKNIWQSVQIEKVDEFTIRFKLNNIYAVFLHNLTVGILPKHLWAGISAANFPLAQYNLKPVGSGPYQFKEFSKNGNGKIESIEFVRNENYYLADRPFIEKITVRFYNSQDALIEAYQKRQIDGISFLSPANQPKLRNNLNIYQINLPIYYAVFFNQTKNKPLADKAVRLALSHATNKDEIIEKVLAGQGQIVNSPLLPDWPGYTSETKIYDFALEHAQNILEAAGWKDIDEDGIREKKINDQDTKLEFTLIATNWPEAQQTAEILKEQWEKIGARINLEIVDTANIQQEYLRPRNYQALLFGEVLNAEPDPFVFWHSTQKKDPGLNLAFYDNKDVDKLLQEARQTMDDEKRNEKYAQFQKLLIEDVPAIFLYSPTYLYPINKKVKGITTEKLAQPSYRFCQIENWYIKTKRVWK
jgi:peptide/nickel transport system substrate-binding protein